MERDWLRDYRPRIARISRMGLKKKCFKLRITRDWSGSVGIARRDVVGGIGSERVGPRMAGRVEGFCGANRREPVRTGSRRAIELSLPGAAMNRAGLDSP